MQLGIWDDAIDLFVWVCIGGRGNLSGWSRVGLTMTTPKAMWGWCLEGWGDVESINIKNIAVALIYAFTQGNYCRVLNKYA